MEDNLAELGRKFWQFEIAGVPLPHVKTHGKIGRREGEWWLKVWGERLLFCADVEPEQVFAVTMPYEGERNLLEFWRTAVSRGNYGELSAISPEMGNPRGWGSFVILKGNNGRSWARDWCGGPWIEFIGPKFPDELPRKALAASGAGARIKLWQRSFPESERPCQNPLWLRGSSEEWQRVLQACAVLHYGKNPFDSFNSKIEPGVYRYYFYSCAPFTAGWMDGFEDYDNWEIPADWQPLLIRNFVFVCWDWQHEPERPPDTRSSWSMATTHISGEIRLSSQPSQHEQLEARLLLRDWLRGKVPAHQLEKLLA